MLAPELIPWLAALFLIVGILALILEIFLAGFGVAGVAGLILVGWGILLLSANSVITFKSLVVGLLVSIILFMAGIRLASKIKLWQRVTLGTELRQDQGYVAPKAELAQYQGQVGIAVTPLRPSGTVDIDGTRLDVVTEGGYIPPRAKVQVVEVTGGRVVVRAVD